MGFLTKKCPCEKSSSIAKKKSILLWKHFYMMEKSHVIDILFSMIFILKKYASTPKNMIWKFDLKQLHTCNLTFTVSNGNVRQSAIHAAVPAVRSCIPSPGPVAVDFLGILGYWLGTTADLLIIGGLAWATTGICLVVVFTTAFVDEVIVAILIFLVSFIRINNTDNTIAHSNQLIKVKNINLVVF